MLNKLGEWKEVVRSEGKKIENGWILELEGRVVIWIEDRVVYKKKEVLSVLVNVNRKMCRVDVMRN